MKLITFEGIEKVGKTTNIKSIAKYLLDRGTNIILTREPGGTLFGEKIREILLDKNIGYISPLSELFLILSARYDHVEKVIVPALMKGKVVLCDRFIDSTYAYQSGGRLININKVKILEKLFFNNISPDFTFLLNYPIRKSLLRIKSNVNLDRIEKEKISFFIRIKKIYIKRAILKKNKYFIINCDSNLYSIQNTIRKILKNIKVIGK